MQFGQELMTACHVKVFVGVRMKKICIVIATLILITLTIIGLYITFTHNSLTGTYLNIGNDVNQLSTDPENKKWDNDTCPRFASIHNMC